MLDDELRALVSVEPAADFQARVRTRLSGGPTRRLRFGTVWITAALASAAIAVAAFAAFYPLGWPRTSNPASVVPLSSTQRAFAMVPAIPPVTDETPRPSASERAPRAAAEPAVRVHLDRAETRALQRLFSRKIPAAIVDEPTPVAVQELTIPSISIAPVIVDGRAEGERR